MKTLLLAVFASVVLITCDAKTEQKQNESVAESQLDSRDFWKDKPDMATVKAELDKGFDFTEVNGMSDPVALSIVNDADHEIIKLLIDQPGVDLTHLTAENRIYLHWAANKSNHIIADYLLEKGSDINFLDANGHTAFTFAGFQGNLTTDLIDVFVKHGVDLQKKYPEKNGANILLISIPYDKDLTVTDYLVSKGVSIKSVDDEGYTAFHHAAKIGHVDMMKKLVERGVDYDDQALIVASQGTYRTANTIQVYQFLVEELGLNAQVVSPKGQNVLHGVSKKNGQEDIISYFLEKGVDINLTDEAGNTPFINASSKGIETVKLMKPYLKKGSINRINSDGQTALMLAAGNGDSQTVSLLIDLGADVTIKDENGNDAGYYLVANYRAPGSRRGPAKGAKDPFPDKLKALIQAGYDPNATQENGKTLLHLAAESDNLNLVEAVVSSGTAINKVDEDGTTPLQIAAMKATDDQVLKFLVEKGADKSVETGFGETAYDLAAENETLMKAGIDIQFLK
ncbi:ankyrin repeat domain-containing protein [Marinoscillum pacificum]|uniref:ankyrin repeat domain-containing protein n=1 Tax=Marinoscillum pacificum TaxID=392723 RepID=UPI0021578EBF|nr:ankyrin repeat domain-containing protein [Marinoscillum pacificum]